MTYECRLESSFFKVYILKSTFFSQFITLDKLMPS